MNHRSRLPFAVLGLAAGLLGSGAFASAGAIEPVVHRYAAGEGGIFVNAYLVELPAGVVAVDSTLTVSDSKALRAQLDGLGKPLLAVILTHGHPDHYNGATELVAGASVPILATAGVDRVIREHDAEKEAQWRPTFKDEWPLKRTFPTRTVKDGERVVLGGATFTVHDLGPGESHSDSYWTVEGKQPILFVGDLVMSGVHAYLSDGHSGAWLANLSRVSRQIARGARIYPGHGDPGGTELFEAQARYLEAYRAKVKALASGAASLSQAQKQELSVAMEPLVPSGRLKWLVPLGADAVAAELAGAKGAPGR
jgi:glyoxylase-like metal-dependent hydrolase (beta-lactamase superfamily II)